MSTIVVTRKDGYAAIGADTLTTWGSTKESAEYIANCSKIIRVGESLVGAVGHASWELVLASYFSRLRETPRLDSVEAIFEAARDLHRALKRDYYLNPVERRDDEFESSQFYCLIANPSGIFGLYSRRSVQEYRKFFAFGSGCEYALGAMHAVYDGPGSAEEIVRAGLEAAAAFDDAPGPPLEVHTARLER